MSRAFGAEEGESVHWGRMFRAVGAEEEEAVGLPGCFVPLALRRSHAPAEGAQTQYRRAALI